MLQGNVSQVIYRIELLKTHTINQLVTWHVYYEAILVI